MTPRSPSRLVILNTIGDHFQSIMQWWDCFDGQRAAEYENKAEALIEILEANDCGSHGGYDKGQEFSDRKTLFHRWNWLYRKYNNPEKKRFGCNIVSYEQIKHFYTR